MGRARPQPQPQPPTSSRLHSKMLLLIARRDPQHSLPIARKSRSVRQCVQLHSHGTPATHFLKLLSGQKRSTITDTVLCISLASFYRGRKYFFYWLYC